MQLNRAIIEDITFNGKLNGNDITGFINKLLHSNNLIAEVYIRNKCLLTSKVKFYIEHQHVIASINKLFALDRTETSDNIVILIKEAGIDNVIISSNTPTKNLLISMCDTEADLQFAVLSTNQYNIDDINIDKSRFIPIGDSKLSKINLDECKDLNGDIDPDEDVSVWKLSVDRRYTFSHNCLVNWTEPDNPENYVILYNSDQQEVEYENGMILACRRSASSSWSNNDIDGYTIIANPDKYYNYNASPDDEPIVNNNYVCAANSSYTYMSGVLIYKVNIPDINVVVGNVRDSDEVVYKLLTYEKDNIRYYNLSTIDKENSNEWITMDQLINMNYEPEPIINDEPEPTDDPGKILPEPEPIPEVQTDDPGPEPEPEPIPELSTES